MSFLDLFGPTFGIFQYLIRYWWVWFGPVSFVLFRAIWLAWRQQLYKAALQYTLLEIKFPREILKSPRAMEQFFAALHSLRNSPGDIVEIYLDGEVTLWFSFEIVTFGGDIHFFIRTPTKHRGVLEANLYANYPSIEIEEAKDYMSRFPKTLTGLAARGLDLWGTELVLDKPDPYPIRTYVQYEGVDEERSLDPISSILEIFRKVDRKENIMLQMLLRPAGADWKKRGDDLVNQLKKKDVQVRQSAFGEYEQFPVRTPGETEVLKAIEASLTKPGYETLIRFIYIADKSVYSIDVAKRGVTASFNQHADQSLNRFKHNERVYTQARWINYPYFFPAKRAETRKAIMLRNYRRRKMPEETLVNKYLFIHGFSWNIHQKTFVLNTEELATLYHPPTNLVLTAPLIRRVESKRMGPPVSSDIFDEGDNT